MHVTSKDEVLNFPGVCVFTRDSEGPFLDTDTYLNARDLDGVDPYGYIAVQKVIDMGRAVGMVEAEKVEELKDQLAAYAAQVEELQKIADAIVARDEADKVLEEAIA